MILGCSNICYGPELRIRSYLRELENRYSNDTVLDERCTPARRSVDRSGSVRLDTGFSGVISQASFPRRERSYQEGHMSDGRSEYATHNIWNMLT